jgi:eukaryotic-like serine/threonine-protein kinase
MPSRFRVWSVGRLLLLVCALGGTFLLFFGVALRVALRAREVQVPALVGKTVNEATQSLGSLGLTLKVDPARRADPKIAATRIMLQDPPAGAAARAQRSIRVWLSTGPRTTTVPELIGQTERTARLRLAQDGVELDSVSEFRSPDYPADAVVSQDPPPDARAPKVSLLLNRGEESTTYVMPDVIGMDAAGVADALRARGFRATITGSQPYPGVPPGTVVRQQPQGGFRVAASDPISLEVSR